MTKQVTEQINVIQQAVEAATRAHDQHEMLIEELETTHKRETQATLDVHFSYLKEGQDVIGIVNSRRTDVVGRLRQVELRFLENLPDPDKTIDGTNQEMLQRHVNLVDVYYKTTDLRINDLKTFRTRQANRKRMQVFAGFVIAIVVIGIAALLIDSQQRQQQADATATQVAMNANATATQAESYANATATQAESYANATATQAVIRENINSMYLANLNTSNYNFPHVVANPDWTVVEQEIDGTVMVLVPAGCFMMGSEDGDSDERPMHEQCIEEPYWLDKYEVTNEAYGSVGCESWSSAANEPRNCVNWRDARAYCESKGGRLPSELEWEWAVRGPESWEYPWGDEFDASRVVYDGNSGNHVAAVGSRITGASWVGAQDMAGNLWEWTRSGYRDYPYDAGDGREGANENRPVLRGGSFRDSTSNLRSTDRSRNNPFDVNFSNGFRCSRSLSQ